MRFRIGIVLLACVCAIAAAAVAAAQSPPHPRLGSYRDKASKGCPAVR